MRTVKRLLHALRRRRPTPGPELTPAPGPSPEWEQELDRLRSFAQDSGQEGPAFIDAPTEPGSYLDRQGDLWTLSDDLCWTDCHGVTGPVEASAYIGAFGPFTAVDPSHGIPTEGQ